MCTVMKCLFRRQLQAKVWSKSSVGTRSSSSSMVWTMWWYGLFMHFCESNHQITQMWQEEMQYQRSQIDFMSMKI